MANKISENLAKKYECVFCDFISINKSDYKRHLSTVKHKRLTNANKNTEISENQVFTCNCGRIYKHKSSLSKHKNKCQYNLDLVIKSENKEQENKQELKSLIIKIMTDSSEKMNILMNENKELRKQITEMIPRIGNNNNTLKQKFNINVFLNEKCKDALSIDEFIDKIDISIKNLLTTKEKGQTQGISNIIMENMNQLSLYERPLHCTDKKRETIYIKNQEWEKDDNREHINKLLKQVEKKQLQNIQKWLDEHPHYMNNEKEQNEFTELLRECSKSIDDNQEKIIKGLCNELYIDKE